MTARSVTIEKTRGICSPWGSRRQSRSGTRDQAVCAVCDRRTVVRRSGAAGTHPLPAAWISASTTAGRRKIKRRGPDQLQVQSA